MTFIKSIILLFFLFTTTLIAANNTSLVHFNAEEEAFIKNNPIINVGAETDWPPFDFVENGKYTGFAKDYLDLIEQKSNLKFNYITDTWTNLLKKTKDQEIDLLPCLAKDENRETFLNFTDPYIITRDYLFAKESNTSINNIKDIDGKTVAIVKGYIHDKIIRKEHPLVKIYYTDSFLEAIDAVITNKADFIVANIALINYLTKKHSISNIGAKFHFAYRWNKLYMATNKKSTILRDIIQKSLNAISSDQKSKIEQKWISDKIEQNENTKSELNLTIQEEEYLYNKKTITIANELGWIPYDYFENDTAKGYVIDYMKLLCEKIGLEPIFLSNKWNILFNQFKKGEIDILPVVSYNKKRESFTNYTKSYLSQKLSIVTKMNNNSIINKDDLKNKKIGMVKDWNLTNFFRENYPNIRIIEFDSLKDVFDALKNNFIEATVQNTLISKYYIKEYYFGELKIVSPITLKNFDEKLYIGVNKNSNTLHLILNKAIDSVTKEELKQLDDKWINTTKKLNFTKEEQKFIDNTIIKAIASNNWAPFNFINDGSFSGISLDIWKYIVDKANIKTKITGDDIYLNVLESLKNKEQDIVLSASKTINRDKYAIFSNIYLKTPIGIATLNDKNYIKDASELIGKKIGIGRGFSAYELIKERYPDIDFKLVDSVEEGLRLLSEDKIYAYVDVLAVLNHNIKNFGFSNIKITGQTGVDYDLRFMVRNDYPLLVSIINKVLNKMSIEDKNLIYNKWINTKFEEKVDYSLLWKTVIGFLVILLFVLYKNRELKIYQNKLILAQKDTDRSLNNFKTLIDLNIAGILIIRNKKITYINNECVKMLGYKSENQLINKNISFILNIDEVEKLSELLKEDNSYEISAIKSDYSYFPVLLKGKEAVFDNLPSQIVSIIDLTEIKSKEELLLQQSKMASLGEMIGNIAHQWRQPLSAISTTASGAKLQKEFGQLDDKNFNEAMDTITETSKFLSQTIDDFRNYIKDNKEKKYFNIKSSIERILSIMKGTFTNHFINVEINVPDLEINNYENEFTQVLLNIFSNSNDALKNVKEENRKIFINSSQKENTFNINIIDTGGGIDTSIINKIFEPYFTTKHKSQGTGLGLFMTHKIVKESMKGDISIENCSYDKYKNCTKVTISIPIT